MANWLVVCWTRRFASKLALVTAQQNHCDYRLPPIRAIGKLVGPKPEIVESREGKNSRKGHDCTHVREARPVGNIR